jgi:hypothetical protein
LSNSAVQHNLSRSSFPQAVQSTVLLILTLFARGYIAFHYPVIRDITCESVHSQYLHQKPYVQRRSSLRMSRLLLCFRAFRTERGWKLRDGFEYIWTVFDEECLSWPRKQKARAYSPVDQTTDTKVVFERGEDLDRWAYWNNVELDFSRPGKPSDNALVEAFNSRLRQECLNQHWFLSLEDARRKLSAWQNEYNTERPHIALGYRTPREGRIKVINVDAVAA